MMKQGIIYKPTGKMSYCGWPTVSKLDDGTLICVFSGARLKHVCPFGKTVACYSRDGGKTWSGPTEIINTAFDDRDGGIAVRGKQVLVASFNNTHAFQRQDVERDAKYKTIINDYCDLVEESADLSDVCSSIAVSEDGGYVFATRYPVPISSPHGPIVLKDGRYCYVGRSFRPNNCDFSSLAIQPLEEGIFCAFSSDGYNWTKPEPVFINKTNASWCEPDVIELENGELLVQIRVQGNEGSFDKLEIFQTVSQNGITAWSKPVNIGVDGSPPSLMRHSSGAIVCVYGKRTVPYAEMAIISYDEGKTWSDPIVVDGEAENADMGYPSSVELDDGSILTAYYQHEKKGEDNYVKYTVWTLPEKTN